MNPKSTIAKGKRFEDWIANQVKLAGLGDARREIGSGSGKRKGDIAWGLEFTPECKNEATVPSWLIKRIEQAEMQAMGAQPWVLFVRDPRKGEGQMQAFTIMDFQDWLGLVQKSKEPKIKEPDRAVAWKLKRLIQAAKELLKELET